MPGLMSIRRRSVHNSPCKLFGVVMHHSTHYSTLSLHIGVLLQNIKRRHRFLYDVVLYSAILYLLYEALCKHSRCNLLEAGDVRTNDEVVLIAILLCRL